MTDGVPPLRLRYAPLDPQAPGALYLVAGAGTAEERRVPFYRTLEIGRDDGREALPGVLLVPDPAVSHRHCILSRMPDGLCYVRDVSRNGTRVGGRRLVPNIETVIHPGETLTVGSQHLVFEAPTSDPAAYHPVPGETAECSARTTATVLVGDLRDYTGLVRRASPEALQRSVGRVFETLTQAVLHLGGTIKEYPGDAVVAFWEGSNARAQAIAACHAALDLHQLALRMAADPTVWQVDGLPMRLDWGLATGPVMLESFGGEHPHGLSLVGVPVVLAFRLESLAGDETGPIVACADTFSLAAPEFVFRDLGELTAKGFDRAVHTYALDQVAVPATATLALRVERQHVEA